MLKERLAALHKLEGAIRRSCRLRVLISLGFEDCDNRSRTADEVAAYGRTFGTDGGTGLRTYSQYRAPDPVGMSHLWGI